MRQIQDPRRIDAAAPDITRRDKKPYQKQNVSACFVLDHPDTSNSFKKNLFIVLCTTSLGRSISLYPLFSYI